MLGERQRFAAVPFFWTEHHGVSLAFVGHAENRERMEIEGQIEAHDCSVTYWRGGRKLAMVTIGRDLESLRSELESEGAATASKSTSTAQPVVGIQASASANA